MESLMANLADWKPLEVISFILIFKGIGTMDALKDSIKELSSVVGKLQVQFDSNKEQLGLIRSKLEENQTQINSLRAALGG